jgi:hypothetical protein
MGRACGTNGRGEKIVKVLVEKQEEKIPLVRPKRRWEDGIRLDFWENG